MPTPARFSRVPALLLLAAVTPAALLAGSPPLISVVDDPPVNRVGWYTSIAVGTDGLPVISYYDLSAADLKVAKCNDEACTGGDETRSVVDASGFVGEATSIAIGADGFPVISYFDSGSESLKVAWCDDPACSGGGETISVIEDSPDMVGWVNAIRIGADGLPVIAYLDSTANTLKVAKCNDPACAGGDETISTVDPTVDQSVREGLGIVIGVDGLPVIAYQAASELKVAKCNDPACSGGDETITTVEDAINGSSGGGVAIALGGDGFPVIAYKFEPGAYLNVIRCNDPACQGEDETVSTLDGPDVMEIRIALDPTDLVPVVSYLANRYGVGEVLYLTKCNDVACSAGGDSRARIDGPPGQDGSYLSLAIGADGFPVMSYLDLLSSTLKAAKCFDSDCNATVFADGGFESGDLSAWSSSVP